MACFLLCEKMDQQADPPYGDMSVGVHWPCLWRAHSSIIQDELFVWISHFDSFHMGSFRLSGQWYYLGPEYALWGVLFGCHKVTQIRKIKKTV